LVLGLAGIAVAEPIRTCDNYILSLFSESDGQSL
jgi:hypothetical protein